MSHDVSHVTIGRLIWHDKDGSDAIRRFNKSTLATESNSVDWFVLLCHQTVTKLMTLTDDKTVNKKICHQTRSDIQTVPLWRKFVSKLPICKNPRPEHVVEQPNLESPIKSRTFFDDLEKVTIMLSLKYFINKSF